MQVRVNLMGGLKVKAPANNVVDLPEAATIDDLLQALDIDPAALQTVMVNSKPEKDRSRMIAPGDEFTLLPPVAGG